MKFLLHKSQTTYTGILATHQNTRCLRRAFGLLSLAMLVSDNLHETRKPYTLIQFDFGKYNF
jgi:hypothetical protein